MVDMEHDGGCGARPAAEAAARAVASEDPEAESGGEGIAGTPGAAALCVDCRG